MTTSWEFTATQLLRFDDRTARRSRPWPAGSMCRGASEGASVRIFLLHGRNDLTSNIIILFGRVRELEAHAAWRPSLRRWGNRMTSGWRRSVPPRSKAAGRMTANADPLITFRCCLQTQPAGTTSGAVHAWFDDPAHRRRASPTPSRAGNALPAHKNRRRSGVRDPNRCAPAPKAPGRAFRKAGHNDGSACLAGPDIGAADRPRNPRRSRECHRREGARPRSMPEIIAETRA